MCVSPKEELAQGQATASAPLQAAIGFKQQPPPLSAAAVSDWNPPSWNHGAAQGLIHTSFASLTFSTVCNCPFFFVLI